MRLEIAVTNEGDLAQMRLMGRLDVRTAPELEAAVKALPQSSKNIDMDFSQVAYVASAGIRELLRAAKRCEELGGAMRIMHPSEEALEPFGTTNLALVLTIVP